MKPGDQLAAWTIPITTRLVVSTAIATRDFQDVHHDRDLAQSYGSQDIFVNILTTNGLVERYVTDWTGSVMGWDVQVKAIAIRLGAPAYPGAELTFSGSVAEVDGSTVVVEVAGSVPSGTHVSGRVTIEVPA